MIIYLHGFRSGPASIKARALQAHLARHGLSDFFWCEQLAIEPKQAIKQVSAAIENTLQRNPERRPTLVGSSLGGYYATWLSEHYDLATVLINPAVVAPLSLQAWLGPSTNLYTGESFILTEEHIAQLRALDVMTLSKPENFWLLLETGDEVLDYREAVRKYSDAQQTVLKGGNHGFSRWNMYLDDIVRFAGHRLSTHGAD